MPALQLHRFHHGLRFQPHYTPLRFNTTFISHLGVSRTTTTATFSHEESRWLPSYVTIHTQLPGYPKSCANIAEGSARVLEAGRPERSSWFAARVHHIPTQSSTSKPQKRLCWVQRHMNSKLNAACPRLSVFSWLMFFQRGFRAKSEEQERHQNGAADCSRQLNL